MLSRESRSSEKFMHGIKVLMAKNYIDNLSEEARKGMQEKAEQGIWPTKTPLGYRNITGPDGKKIIAVDPDVAPIITKLFEWYATGQLSLKEAAKKAQTAGLVYRKSGAKVPVSTVQTSCAVGSTLVCSIGRESSFRESTNLSFLRICGSECRVCWMAVTPTSTVE